MAAHRSDMLRLLLVLTYGGAYLDTDSVTQAPFPADIPNFIVRGDGSSIKRTEYNSDFIMNLSSAKIILGLVPLWLFKTS